MDYWKECIASSFDEHGIEATDEQIAAIARDIEISHDQYGMACGHDCIPNPVVLENDRLKRDIQIEREKVICKECNGRGEIIIHGYSHDSISQCSRCRGDGRHTP